jgi:hypothetical protein
MTEPSEILALAEQAPADSVDRHLLVVAAIDAALEPTVVVVGGAAINVHTGTYQPTDIDLVGDVTPADRERLVDIGFAWRGIGHRHVSYEFADGEIVLVEFPSSELAGIREPQWREVRPGIGVWLVALDDLMMDRLQQATDGTAVTMDAALQLGRAAANDIDWDSLAEEATSPGNRRLGVPGVLAMVRTQVGA